MDPVLSEHFKGRLPSVIRRAQIEFAKRKGGVRAVNVAIGNVSLPMHPAMVRRLKALGAAGSPFQDGAVMYTPTVGTEETRKAFLHVLASSGLATDGLQVQVTDGGSQAMELAVTGVCGRPGVRERPLLIIDPTYTNYTAFARRLGRLTVSLRRTLRDDGSFGLPDLPSIAGLIRQHRPGGLLVIPYDNPTGQLYGREQLIGLARLCVEYNLWLISDEAYRELLYTGGEAVSVWALREEEVPGIRGRRLSIESASKVWNACGLRIGALITDSEEFHTRSVAEATATLCPNAIGQHIFAGLLEESHAELRQWYARQRAYYRGLMEEMTTELRRLLPGIIVSSPQASIYSVVDVRALAGEDFDVLEFVLYCAREGAVAMEGTDYTLLVAPMSGFYDTAAGEADPGRTQMRIAYVPPPDELRLVPRLLAELLRRFLERRGERAASSSDRRDLGNVSAPTAASHCAASARG
jgi:aspartate aminotransferase